MKSSTIAASTFVVAFTCLITGCSSSDGTGDGTDPTLLGTGGSTLVGAGGGSIVPVGAGGGYVPPAGAGGSVSMGAGGTTPVGMGGSTSLGGASATGGGGGVPAGGGAGGGGGVSGGGGGGGALPEAKPLCVDKQNEVVIMGDSYVTGAASPALQPALGAIDPNATQYRNYAVAGVSMVSGGLPLGFVPSQFDTAVKASKDIRLVIMDGGGNDILICDAGKYPTCGSVCNAAGSSKVKICQDIVAGAIDGAKTLFLKMGDAGVKDVVFFYYPHIPANGGGYSEILDYAEPIAKASCDNAYTTSNGKVSCHWVSSVEAFKAAGGDKNPANFAGDGIHPSDAGQKIMAKLIEDRMKADCLGQASGCCQ